MSKEGRNVSFTHMFPMLCGYDLVLFSDSKFVKNKFRTKRNLAKKVIVTHAMAFAMNSKQTFGIYIPKRNYTYKEFVAVLSHECSHLCDYIFKLAQVKVVDTELRAYMYEYIFEMYFIVLKKG